MASTPHDFVLQEGSLAGVKKTGVNEEAMKQPFAFVDQTSSNADCVVKCDGAEDEAPTVLDENSDFLGVLMQVCEERGLPVALKIGAHRGVNPKLKSAGDGVVAFADAGVLGRLCARYPKVLFLATFLSRNNQHEAAVLASKFRVSTGISNCAESIMVSFHDSNVLLSGHSRTYIYMDAGKPAGVKTVPAGSLSLTDFSCFLLQVVLQ